MDLRSELTDAKAERAVIEKEVHDQLLQLHALQLQLHAKQGQAEDSDSIKDRLVGRRRRYCSQPSDYIKLNFFKKENCFLKIFLTFCLYLIETV